MSFEKIVLLVVLAAVILGPANLPKYAQMLGSAVRRLRDYTTASKERLQAEGNEALADIDWKKLDPRQYDPRRIIADALKEDSTPASRAAIAAPVAQATSVAATERAERERNQRPAPFDSEAT